MLRFELPAGVCWPRIEAGKAQRLRSTRSEDFSAADAQMLLQLAALAAAHVHAAPAAVASLASPASPDLHGCEGDPRLTGSPLHDPP